MLTSRNAEFQSGLYGNPAGVVRNSVLMPYMRSPNGMSSKDALRQTPLGQMPSSNGFANSTYNQIFPTGIPTREGF